MSKAKNMHYLSQMISRNFLKKDDAPTFLLYDPVADTLVERNIKKLFSRYRPWGEEFEKVLSGYAYENTIAPEFKALATCDITRNMVIGPSGIVPVQFNAIMLDEDKNRILTKLFLQTVLLQRSNEKPQEQLEAELSKMFTCDFKRTMNLLLVEINPACNSVPLVLTDSMLFHFLCPDKDKNTLGHMCFMMPVSEQRLLLWVSRESDYRYFCSQYHNIHFLNLCRIEQNDKKCKIALAKNPKNEAYLKILAAQIPGFRSNIEPQIRIAWNWER